MAAGREEGAAARLTPRIRRRVRVPDFTGGPVPAEACLPGAYFCFDRRRNRGMLAPVKRVFAIVVRRPATVRWRDALLPLRCAAVGGRVAV